MLMQCSCNYTVTSFCKSERNRYVKTGTYRYIIICSKITLTTGISGKRYVNTLDRYIMAATASLLPAAKANF